MKSKPLYTSIRVDRSTKDQLDKFKLHPRESYNDVIVRLIKIYEQWGWWK